MMMKTRTLRRIRVLGQPLLEDVPAVVPCLRQTDPKSSLLQQLSWGDVQTLRERHNLTHEFLDALPVNRGELGA